MPSCAEGDGMGGVAETEGVRVQREDEPAMAPEAGEWLPSLSFHSIRHVMGTEGTRKEKNIRFASSPLPLPAAFCIFS